ncbi:patatin-like phospholipase family protein [Prevotella stercorea]|uniref:patatin-like phospholipase family protein n=1 Tax=Leyella stercorea TaxID=363265 RepID=UPI001F3EDDF9|nr:patatin-like phospholipase family protein [Leyella stercorea]MCF2645350.1 patatin-like phospholipase family protein [Leyella stercorea]
MKKNVALVLSSGGARGLAHIGAIEELERSGFNITSIAGCSMGSLIGGMYAAGKLSEVKKWMLGLSKKQIFSLVDFSFSRNHLVKGIKVMDALKEIVPDVNIEDLPIPYTAVATDWNSGREIVFRSGSLYEAIRSSISIPLFFDPVRKDEMLLVDGALVNALPLNRVARSRGDLLVGVNVNTHNYKEEMTPNYINMLLRSIAIMVDQNTKQQALISKPDIVVEAQMQQYGEFDYDKAAQITLIGEQEMHKALDEYQQAHSSIFEAIKRILRKSY